LEYFLIKLVKKHPHTEQEPPHFTDLRDECKYQDKCRIPLPWANSCFVSNTWLTGCAEVIGMKSSDSNFCWQLLGH